jgi:hypothetical protein
VLLERTPAFQQKREHLQGTSAPLTIVLFHSEGNGNGNGNGNSTRLRHPE